MRVFLYTNQLCILQIESRFRMQKGKLGKTLFIVNPAAQSGRGKEHARVIEKYLKAHPKALEDYTIHFTSGPQEATDIAANTHDYDSVVALGGDGVIHEVVNGLMKVDKESRPALGIIPVGSGNDYARTLGITINHPIAALKQVLEGIKRKIDVGLLKTDIEERYFMQTCSFGVDAAIAHDTTTRRAIGTKTTGESLFFTSGLKLFSKMRSGWPCQAVFDNKDVVEFPDIVFAIHIGQTYGGGFKICPDANPADGKFSICHNVYVPKLIATTLGIFLGFKLGKHAHFKTLAFREAKRVDVSFEGDVAPVQVDGEEIQGSEFTALIEPLALQVYTGKKLAW